MNGCDPDPIDVYRVNVRHPRRLSTSVYPVRPRWPWSRTWQAEWDGCRRAPRAWTERGVRRKAVEAMLDQGLLR